MSGVFRVPFAYTGNASVDLSESTAASGKPLVCLGWDIGQTSDVGDTAEEILALTLKTGTSGTTSGSGGSSVTPVNTDQSGGSASFTAEQANTTKLAAGSGAITTHGGAFHWNVRMPMQVRLTQEEQVIVPAGSRIALEIPAAADSLTIAGHMILQEIG